MVDLHTRLLITLLVERVEIPILLLATSLSLLLTKPSPPGSPSPITSVVVSVTSPRRSLILTVIVLVAVLYFLDGLTLVIHSVISKNWQGTPKNNWWDSQWSGLEFETIVGLLASSLFAILALWKEAQGVAVWSLKLPKVWAALAVIGSIVEVALIASTVDFLNKQPVSIPEKPSFAKPTIPNILHSLFPLLRLLVLIPLYPALVSPRVSYVPASEGGIIEPREDTNLLVPTAESSLSGQGLSLNTGNGQSAYGTFGQARSIPATGTNTRSQTPTPIDQDGIQSLKGAPPAIKDQTGESSKSEAQTWGQLYRRLAKIAPFLWPWKSSWLQFIAVLCFLVLGVGRLVNAVLPLTLGALIDTFESLYEKTPPKMAYSFWPLLLAYAGLRFLQSGGGLSALRNTLWAPVMQYSDREMSQMTFNHLLSLSLSFHMRRKTGEVLRILDRGQAINRVFELLLFNIVPAFVDIIVALGIFIWKFGWELAVVVAVVMFTYIVASVTITTWRSRIRRQMNDKDIITRGIHTDCLLNYETVKYFVGEAYEGERYASAIRDYQDLEYRVILSLNLLNLVQGLVIAIGLLVGGMIVAFRVTRGVCTPSEFVVFITYLGQLYLPLSQLGFVYRSINTSLIDTERLMKLLEEPTEVNDKPGAPDLIVDEGEIEFDNVSFSYDGRTTALKGVSFKVPKGSSVALVGESGSGKSSVLRLLYRFYDLKEGEGRILIDGQDIRDVTQLSLRKAIGVVPQDSVLFNASIGYNIGYGQFGASPEEIEAAAKAAQMHERIVTFPDGYNTKVGERGIRLSGGEKQRVAIARTLLKNPPILLLDEATSALDTSTEKDIQKALQNLVRGRSSLSIAHRLSTIASADLILVLKDGQIVEQGSHRELLEKDGIFATMWADQISTEEPTLSFQQSDKQEISGYSVEQSTPTKEALPNNDEAIKVDDDEIAPPFEETAGTEAAEPASHEVAKAGDEESIPAPDQPVEPEPVTFTEEPAGTTSEPEANPETASYAAVASTEPAVDAPVVFPVSASEAAAADSPVTFPTSEEPTEVVAFPTAQPQTPGVTFDVSADSTPRSGTPDPSSEPKRKRTASQNFQRFARRVSLVTRKSGSSSSIPVPSPRKEERPSTSKDSDSGRVEAGDSPASSILGDDGKKGKKDRRGLKKRLSMGK